MKKETFFALLCLLFLLGCTTENEVDPELDQPAIETTSQLYAFTKSQNMKSAKSALVRYFGKTMVLQSLADAPSGMIEIVALEIKSGQQRKFYLLPDLRHLIAGVLYSPYMKPSDITAQHSNQTKSLAKLNQTQALATADFKQTLRNAIKNQQPSKANLTQATKDNLNQQSQAVRSHVKAVNDFSPTMPQTAPLPSNYSGVDAQAIYASLEQTEYIQSGNNSDKVLYVFFDFRCPACMQSHADLLPRIEKEEVQVRFVPVGILGEQSEAKATYVLIEDKMEARLALMKKLMGKKTIAQIITDKPDREQLNKGWQRYLANTKLLIATQKVMTPLMVYRTKTGVTIQTIPPGKQMTAAIQNISKSG